MATVSLVYFIHEGLLCCPLDYKRALHDFTLVAGKIPVPPRYAFGVFYSRYWAYSDTGQMVLHYANTIRYYCIIFRAKEVVNGYRSRNIPLDNLVTDMDWHITFYKEHAKDPVSQLIISTHNCGLIKYVYNLKIFLKLGWRR